MEAFELAGLVLTWKVGLNAGVSALCSAFVTIFVIFSIERFGGIIGGVIAYVVWGHSEWWIFLILWSGSHEGN
jgi:hypothetical protein